MDSKTPSVSAIIDEEVEWGKHYRQQKKQGRRPSISPKTSPINMQKLWERYQITRELLEIEKFKLQMPIARPAPKFIKLSKTKGNKVDRAGFTKKQYIDYLATPHQYHVPKEPTLDDKAKLLRKKLKKKETCSPRLVEIAKPTKVRVLSTWLDYQSRLPMDFITRLDELLRTDHTLDPKFARCCFRELDRKRNLELRKLRKKRRKELRKRKIASQKWLKQEIRTTAKQISSFFYKEPLLALNFKQMLLSAVVLVELYNRGDIKFKPVRTSNKPYHQSFVDIVDQLAVWMDTIFRYVDVQYTESADELLGISSFGSMEGEEEEEEEEEEEDDDGDDSEPQRYTLPPIPPLPPMSPDLKVVYSESEDDGRVPKVGFAFDLGDSETEAMEDISQTTGTQETRSQGSVSMGRRTPDKRSIASVDDDMLQHLINILNTSPSDVLKQLVDDSKLPNVTHEDVLNRIKQLKDEQRRIKTEENRQLLEDTLIKWVSNTDPDKLDNKLRAKIKDTAGLISEFVDKPVSERSARTPPLSISEPLTTAEEASRRGKLLPTLPEEETLGTEDDISDITSSVGDRTTEDGKRELELDDELSSDITSTEKQEKDVEERLAEGGGESNVSAWVIKPTGSQTKLPTLKDEQAEDQRGTSDVSIDMSGALKVVMEETPGATSDIALAAREEEERMARELGEDGLRLSRSIRSKESKGSKPSKESESSKGFAGRRETGSLKGKISDAMSKSSKGSKLPSLPPEIGEDGDTVRRRTISKIIFGHQPSHVFDHAPDTICCLTLKVYATWLLEVANNAHAWSKWLSDIISEIRRIASIIRGDVKDAYGKPVMFYKEDWTKFSEKVEKMIVSWRQYSMHVKDLTDKIIPKFQGKRVICCPKCLQDNLISDIAAAHEISEQLAEALNTTTYWRRWLDDIVMETRRLTKATVPEVPSDTSSYGTMDIIEIHEPRRAESEESLYEIEEIGSVI